MLLLIQLTITDELNVNSGYVSMANDVLLHIAKLKQLAICAGFDFVSTYDSNSFVEVGISPDERHITKRTKSAKLYLNTI